MILFKNSLYLPNHNICGMGEIAGQNTLILFCQFLLFTILTTIICHMFCFKTKLNKEYIFPSQMITLVCMLGFVLFASVQQIHRHEHSVSEAARFHGKTPHEKKLLMFGKIYELSQLCKKILPGRHQGEIITDLDRSKDPYMLWFRLLDYLLYPEISLRFKNQTPKDCLILFYKENALRYIPKDYKVLIGSEDNHFILAIKEDASQ
jgi:hypothetical protein